jgi:CRP/FNR family cyclic AMP-dependent transcriptional regulator
MGKTDARPGGKMLQTIFDLLCNVPMFDRLDVKELNIVAQHMNLIEVNAGEYVFKEGDSGDYVCFVVDGSLDVLKRSETGSSAVIATLNRGRSIGEMSVVDEFPRSATVKARTKTTLVTLTRNGFNVILDNHSKVGVKILRAIVRLVSQNLRRTSSCLADYL